MTDTGTPINQAVNITEPLQNTTSSVLIGDESEKSLNKLKELCLNNAEFFSKDSSENGQRLYISFLAINDALDLIWPKLMRIQEHAKNFDFDENTYGNGYRSYLSVVDSAIKFTLQVSEKISVKRETLLFRKTSLTKDIESCAHIISSLDTCLKHLETLISWSTKGNLFPEEDHSPIELLSRYEDINQYCFYGRCMGFQFCDTLRHVLNFIALSMAIFSEAYYSQGSLISKATTSVMSTPKYITDPEQRARRIVNISQRADVDFCKSFWFLSESELMNHIPSVVSPSIAISKVINLLPEPFTINVNGQDIEVPVPNSYLGKRPVQVRLISSKTYEGMLGTANMKNLEPPARGFVLHCHGGGFVAQSSKSHEGYLRDWAKHLNVPIFSVDYSLAPEAPFPRALEEVTFAYCWALKNHALLGSTGERIVGAGDSAGANLLLATTLKCINLNVPPPMGVFVAYAPTVVNFIPSPSRLLCMMDPLLPFGFMMRCLKAYACPDPKLKKEVNSCENSDTESFEEISESDLMELQAHKSPISETSDTLTYGSLSSNAVEDLDRNGKYVLNNDLNTSDVEESQKYVNDFLEKYVLDSDTETDGTKVPILKTQESASSSQTFDNSIQTKVSSFVTNLKGRFSKFIGDKVQSGAEKYLDVDKETNLLDEFRFVVPRDPYLSPYFASDEDLSKFPPTRVLSVHLDPCLDDCIMFAKKLKALNKDVKLDILEGLPHGFLNFSLISREAYAGSMRCIERIKELLDLENLPPPTIQ